jgi:drug/metabolite transporter (DMT)-like permease
MQENQPLIVEQTRTGDGSILGDRLKFVSYAFSGLQGLYMVAGGVGWAIYAMVTAFWGDSLWGGLWLFLLITPLFFACIIWIPRYYTRRFGVFRPRPAPVPRPWSKKQMLGLILIGVGLYFLLRILEHSFHPRVDLGWLLMPLLLPCFILVGPWRKLRSKVEITVISVASVILALVAFLPLWVAMGPIALSLWKALFAGTGWVALGLCDYITLTRLLPKTAAEDDQ